MRKSETAIQNAQRKVRWQIELTFQRMKSLVQFGHLPKYNDHSSPVWLYRKLFGALLAPKLMRTGSEIFP